ncbi:hypothetical protein [Bailinhaonella thermotolerans]|uniref:hypothetical protein n=1 Tax=Bailinhaonella thermotolerans TaxID=1070861 RepID=UPI00192A1AE2|nr:hypothetical protein [Bailinhaonella thermotolerans]
MGEFTATIQERLEQAYAELRSARASGDDFLADAQAAEIEDLRRVAAEHGVELTRCA